MPPLSSRGSAVKSPLQRRCGLLDELSFKQFCDQRTEVGAKPPLLDVKLPVDAGGDLV